MKHAPLRIKFLLAISFLALRTQSNAQSSSEIYQRIKKLDVIGSVLYFAAHPDDENTDRKSVV